MTLREAESPARTGDDHLTAFAAASLFLVFAAAYFLAALLRGVTATLAPNFSVELGLGAGDLGLLGGAFFLGFCLPQLPLGSALDRYGPRRVSVAFMALAVVGCAAFAAAQTFGGLTLARALIGVGVSAGLMAPLTTFRHRFAPAAQMRANSWMLMSGSLGMVASTLPTRALLPFLGWRGLFWLVAAALALATLAIAWRVPRDPPPSSAHVAAGPRAGYGAILRHPAFLRVAPIGFFMYGGLIAIQSLWAGPWLVDVSGLDAKTAAGGLFVINVAMLVAFTTWGIVVPSLYRRGWTAQGIVTAVGALPIVLLVVAIVLGPAAGPWLWAAFCVSCTPAALLQPALGMAFPSALAGRVLSAYNLMIFAGVFVLQWGLGLCIDAFRAAGWDRLSAYRGSFALLTGCCAISYLWFLWRGARATAPNDGQPTRTADNPPPCPE